MARPKRPKTELQLYRERIHGEKLARREKLTARVQEQLEIRRDRRDQALAEARAEAIVALEKVAGAPDRLRLERVESDGSDMWSGLAVGLGVAALVGVAGVVVYLLVRKQDSQVVGIQGLGHSQPIIINGGGGGITAELSGSLQSLASSLAAPTGMWSSSVMKSYRLNSLTDRTRGAIRVAQATDVPYEVALRTLGIPGAYAAFAMSPGELDQYRGNTATDPPVGDVVILPTSQYAYLKLKPREVLYAKGSTSGIIVSVTANEVAGGALRHLR